MKGLFYFDFLFQNRLCGTDKATAVYYDKTREGNYKGKIQAKIPEPLTNQFPARASKDTAVRRHRARKQLQTELFPSGI